MKIEKALVIAPHADDETFGCGGTIAKLSQNGIWVDLLLGSLGYDMDTAILRKDELEKAIEILGIQEYRVLPLGTERCQDQTQQLYLINSIEHEINRGYDLVFIPYPSHHQDHIAIHQACMGALRPGIDNPPNIILMYEYTYPTWEVPNQYNGRLFEDITDTLDKKILALTAYETQMRDGLNPVSPRASVIMAEVRGLSIGVSYAEMFYIIQMKNIL